MGLQVGDFLFGYPIVGLTSTVVTLRLPGNITLNLDRAQFTTGVLETLASIGEYIPIG